MRGGGCGCPWTWLRAIAPLRGGTAPTTRGRATGKQDQPMTKNSELGCQQTPFRQPGAIHGPSYRKAAVITAINRHRRLWANRGVADLLGPAGDCTPAIEALNAPEAQWTGRVRRHGRVQPPCYTHRRPIDGASIARSTALAQRPGIDDGSLVSGWSRFLLSVCLAAFLLLLIRCRRFWVKARESSDNRLPIVPPLRLRHPKPPTAN